MADTGYKFAATINNGGTGFNFTNKANLGADDTSYAQNTSTSGQYDEALLSSFTFGIPASATINGIEVTIGAYDSCADGEYYPEVALSYNGGTNYVTAKVFTLVNDASGANHFPGTVTEYTVGGSADTWGRSWTDSEFANGTLICKYRSQSDSFGSEINTDYVKVRVYYTEGGGGGSTFRGLTLLGVGS